MDGACAASGLLGSVPGPRLLRRYLTADTKTIRLAVTLVTSCMPPMVSGCGGGVSTEEPRAAAVPLTCTSRELKTQAHSHFQSFKLTNKLSEWQRLKLTRGRTDLYSLNPRHFHPERFLASDNNATCDLLFIVGHAVSPKINRKS